MELNLFQPTKEREFTYYDRCAIAFDEDEMKAVRVRVKLEILATPLYRSQNLRYPYYKEFYGYLQSFFQNIYVCETAIHYTSSFVYDYWNQHALIAHQVVSTLQRLKPNLVALSELNVANSGIAAQQFPEAVTASLNAIRSLEIGFTLGSTILPDGSVGLPGSINTFGLPINLLRFKFEVGTVFKIILQSWSLGLTVGGTSPGNPNTEEPYDTDNPNGNEPTPSGGRSPTGEPYGNAAPPQSPRDPTLDPNDFNNAPDPTGGGGTLLLQGWQLPFVSGLQSAGFAIGCPAADINESMNDIVPYRDEVNLGTFPVRVDEAGLISGEDLSIGVPGFDGSIHGFGADGRCGVNGVRAFDS